VASGATVTYNPEGQRVLRGVNDREGPPGTAVIGCVQGTFSYSQATPSYVIQRYLCLNVPSEVHMDST
jgi:hypothetical protein